jgi:hypothetical protein
MKEGAGGDPFDDEDDGSEDVATDSQEAAVAATGGSETMAGRESQVDSQPAADQPSIPWKFRRDGVQDGRDRVPLFLQPETKRAEREFKTSAEGIVNENISLTDLREAAYLVAMEHEVEVVAQLREWGYDFE